MSKQKPIVRQTMAKKLAEALRRRIQSRIWAKRRKGYESDALELENLLDESYKEAGL